MFSFMTRNSSKESHIEKTAPVQTGGFTPPVTNSGHDDNSLFGGMDVATVNHTAPEEPSSTSGFSFMSNSQPEEPVEEVVSSFSFLNSTNDTSSVVTPVSVTHSEPSIDLLSSPVKAAEPPPNLKMSKASAPKAVKKKKRVSRVGLGREDDDDEPEPVANVAAPSTHLSTVAETHGHEDGHSDGENERRPSMQKSASSSAFDFLVESTVPTSVNSVPEEEEPAVTRPALLSFSVPEPPPATTTSSISIMSLADFDGMALPTATTPIIANRKKPIINSAPPAVAVVPTVSKTKVVEKQAAVVVPPVPVNETTQDKSVKVINKFHESVSAMTRVHTSSVEESKRIRHLLTSESNSLISLKSQLSNLENEQAKYAADEDFERADAMTAPIEQTKIDIENKVKRIDELKVEAASLDESFAKQRKDILNACKQTVTELMVTKDQLVVEAEDLKSSEIAGNELEEIRIKVEEERINLEKSHFEKEELALSEELKTTEDAIKSQSGTIQLKKEDLEINLLSVQSEIKALEAQLAAKKADEASLLKELNLVDTKINEVRKKYERQLQRIQDRSYALAETKRECLAEEAALLEEKNAYAKKAKDLVDARVSFIDWTRAVKDDLIIMNLFVENVSVDTNLLGCSTAIKSGNDQTASLESAQQQALAALDNARNVESSLRKEIELLSIESRGIVDQIPKLEAEKKSHASNKRFKEAASVAKDIKDQQTRKEEIDVKIENLGNELANQTAEVEKAEEQYKNATKALTDVQKEQDIVRCQSLVSRANALRSILQKVSSTKSEYQLTPSLSSAVADIFADVVSLFSSEMSIVSDEVQIIKDTHQLPDSMFVVVESEPEPEPEPVTECEPVMSLNTVEQNILESENAAETDPIPVNQAEGDIIVSNVVADEVVDETTSAADNESKIARAKELRIKIAGMNEELNSATENEEYDKAAQLFEDINTENEELQTMLAALGISEEELDSN